MKARNFRYVRPVSLQEALRILADGGGEAVPIAGGQSLLAGLNMRLSAPSLLVDIADLPELSGQSLADGVVRLGAATRHRELLESALVHEHVPLLARAARHIGHVAIRNRGTLGGSLAYADPAAELPACSVALDAVFVLAGPAGEREVRAEDFYRGLFDTDLQPGELIVAVKFPVLRPGRSYGFAELSRRHGDFALAGIACTATASCDRIESIRVVYFGCVDHPKVAQAVSKALAGVKRPLADASAYDQAIRQDLAPDDTPGLRGDTKLHLATVLTRRAINSLSEKAAA